MVDNLEDTAFHSPISDLLRFSAKKQELRQRPAVKRAKKTIWAVVREAKQRPRQGILD